MEERITDIYLPNLPTCRNSYGKHSSNGDRFNNWAICFSIINSRLLVKPFGY